MSSIFLGITVGLGNGTRLKDFRLAEVDNIQQAIDGAWEPNPRLVGVTPADDVCESEIITALRNEHCFVLVEENQSFQSETFEESDDDQGENENENDTEDDGQEALVEEKISLSKMQVQDTTLSAKTKHSLDRSGFETLADLLDYGNKHDGKFTGIDGIEEAQEKKIIKILSHYY